MTVTTSIWAASLTGALLFFLAGFLSAHRRRVALARPVGLEVMPPPPESSEIDLDALRERLSQSDALVSEMRQERNRLVARLEAAEAAPPPPVEQDVAMELDTLRRRAAEGDTLAAENERLRTRAQLSEQLENRVRQLQQEVDRLRTQTVENAAPPLQRPARRSATEGGTEEALESVISRIASTRGARAVALADELGLPIVGWGEDVNSLAAFAAYVDGIGTKATELLPLSGVLRIDVHDRNRATVSLCPMALDDARIVLVTMTAGPGPSTPQMQRVLEGAARMI